MEIVIAIFGLGGLAVIIALLVCNMVESRRHQKWAEENDKRRHGLK